jgi:isoamylase
MLLGGDEMGRTQAGNNNAYCQDNELSWYDWDTADQDLLSFTRDLIAFRRGHPVFRRRRWFQGRAIHGEQIGDLAWFTPEGVPMTDEDWASSLVNALGVWISGAELRGADGQLAPDDVFYVIVSSRPDASVFTIPASVDGEWQVVFDTAAEPGFPLVGATYAAGAEVPVEAGAVVCLRRVEAPTA